MQRIILTLVLTALFLGGAFAAFWYQDLQYTLPTPRPPSLVQPIQGTRPDLGVLLLPEQSAQPELLHFFNPRCPCSRFNITHLRTLAAGYGDKVRFVAILQAEPDEMEDAMEAFSDLGLGMEAVVDTSGEIARRCGVYSTPQAVLLDTEGALYYRGNYNLTRYCSNKDTEFVRIALDSLVKSAPSPHFPDVATISYGCELPANLKTQ